MPRAVKARILRIASCVALLFLFFWPAIYNGQPLFSPDTTAYVRGFDAGVVWLSGRSTVWTTWASDLRARQRQPDDSTVGEVRSLQSPTFIIAGRSVAYGALLYLGELLGGLWASVAIQAAVVLAAVSLTLRHLKLFSWPKLVLTAGALGLFSSLPFFASFLLPDVFAGLSVLAVANLLALGDRLRRWEWVFWVAILAAAVVFHPTHLAIAMVFLAVAIIGRLLRIKVSSAGVVALAFAAAIGLASEFAFAFVVEKVLGVQVARPPVIMARMIADGPGAAYLREKCPQVGLVVCDYVDRLPPNLNSDAFLWDTSAATGVYAPAPIDKRREFGNEQYQFAAAVLAYDPVGQIAAVLNDAFQQLKMVGLSDFLWTPEVASLPGVYAERLARSPVYTKEFPIAIFSALTISVTILSFIFVGVTLIRFWRIVSTEQKVFCFVVLLGEVSNALICGALSGPHERYQARLTWLIPVIALLLYYELSKVLVDRGGWSIFFRQQRQPIQKMQRDRQSRFVESSSKRRRN